MGTRTVLTPSIVPVWRNFCSLSPWHNMFRKGMVLSKVLNPVPGPNVVATRFRRMLDCMACTSASCWFHPLGTCQTAKRLAVTTAEIKLSAHMTRFLHI